MISRKLFEILQRGEKGGNPFIYMEVPTFAMYVCWKYVCTYYFRMLSKKIKVLRPLKAMPLIRKREKQGLSLECHHKVFTAVTYMAKLFPLDILKSTFSIIHFYKLKKSSNVLYLDGGTFNDVIWFFQVIVQLLCHWNFNYQILSNKKGYSI